ncbi:hypothetical protein JCM15457_2457 [Liquorilactobacillus sucicola DSM 21376 = JCM 15457]|uniref:Uncharacterized protein n=1 Tax=Liquorilactobacillus sucicola DSM 21376 = JCM 15457 TaxID=1423806 RepID=A0A023D013_9LACO|nr:hypothetical protein [Liquorilactobacillus sucicola]KRN06406.1 hypothetical protein FD15_GL001027 [Liquorilactobacillus sucicola DSM 21376 = JCM 15457]GAJ27467.1 hypothetical protein JCM15457_2457 [Liquorilactobacillus sucicola DSM 21376 = JCM 15457]
MESHSDWLIQRLDEAADSSMKYENRAFFRAMAATALQQSKRIEQAQGEMDGRLWNPNRW